MWLQFLCISRTCIIIDNPTIRTLNTTIEQYNIWNALFLLNVYIYRFRVSIMVIYSIVTLNVLELGQVKPKLPVLVMYENGRWENRKKHKMRIGGKKGVDRMNIWMNIRLDAMKCIIVLYNLKQYWIYTAGLHRYKCVWQRQVVEVWHPGLIFKRSYFNELQCSHSTYKNISIISNKSKVTHQNGQQLLHLQTHECRSTARLLPITSTHTYNTYINEGQNRKKS